MGPKQIPRQGFGAQVVYLGGDARKQKCEGGDRGSGLGKRALMSPWGLVHWGSPSEVWRRRLRTVPLEDQAAGGFIY